MYRSLLILLASAPLLAAPGPKDKDGPLYFPVKVGAKRVMERSASAGIAREPVEWTETATKDPRLPVYAGGFGSYIKKFPDGVWGYYWGATKEVQDNWGVGGQNSENPKASFGDHWLIEIGSKIYDPSYGTGPFDNLQMWEAASVGGFFRVDEVEVGTNYRLIFRQNPVAADMEVKGTINV